MAYAREIEVLLSFIVQEKVTYKTVADEMVFSHSCIKGRVKHLKGGAPEATLPSQRPQRFSFVNLKYVSDNFRNTEYLERF